MSFLPRLHSKSIYLMIYSYVSSKPTFHRSLHALSPAARAFLLSTHSYADLYLHPLDRLVVESVSTLSEFKVDAMVGDGAGGLWLYDKMQGVLREGRWKDGWSGREVRVHEKEAEERYDLVHMVVVNKGTVVIVR